MKNLVIGIAGGTASGKSTLVRKLKEKFANSVCVIPHDNYYKANSGISLEERTRQNYDHPDAFDTDLMVSQIEKLRKGKAVQSPQYDFKLHDRMKETLTVEPANVIIVEGILIFSSEALRNLMDVKIYVDTDADVRILRRVVRDVKKRGRTLDSVVSQYLTTVKPMHDAFVEPSKRFADIIVPEGGKNEVAFDIIVHRLNHYLTLCENDFNTEIDDDIFDDFD